LSAEPTVKLLRFYICFQKLDFKTQIIIEACPALARDEKSLEFTITRIFMKIFRIGFAEVVKNCQFYFSFLSIRSQINNRDVPTKIYCIRK